MRKDEAPNRELYALLNLSPEASDEEIRKSYRQWAQIYHPDKYQDQRMKDVATENFQRICEAYEILSDGYKRQIYDIYGMEGVTAGLELGPQLTKVEQIKEELERLRRQQEQEKAAAQFRPSGVISAHLSWPDFSRGDGLMRGMTMVSEVRSVISENNAIVIGGNLAVRENAGGGAASVLLKHRISSASSIEFMGSLGLQTLLAVQTTRALSHHCTATMGLTTSLNDGSINLSNMWTRQLSDSAYGNIQLSLGPESFISVGWQKKEENMSATGEIKMGMSSFGAEARYTHHFSSKSHGRISGKFGSNNLELEVGGGRKISDFGTIRMLYSIGIQGIHWKFELHRGGQKLIVPVLLSRYLNPIFATGAFVIPTSLYFLLKKFVVKPYMLKVEKRRKSEQVGKTMAQVQEARTAAEKAQKLLANVANRKRSRQEEIGGLFITKALYGNSEVLKDLRKSEATNGENALEILDVTLPLNFLVTDSGQLKLHEGVKKSGIMGFCDPCPDEPKQLYIEYNYRGNYYEVTVDDYEILQLPLSVPAI